jgi:ribosomal protein S18 acetylase RimI-like enzyme
MMDVRRATIDDVDAIAPLFDLYRSFYEQPSDLALARRFIGERLQQNESVIFLAKVGGKAVGFTQLFPSFSSVGATHVWILNDLYVDAASRRQGVAQALLQAATEFARADGARRLELETDHTNESAQALYRRLGWELFDGTLRFRLPLGVC